MLVGHLLDEGAAAHPGIVEQNVERAELLERGRNDLFGRVVARDIAGERACSIADSGRSTASTCAPSSAKSLAEAAPMPDAAPVTIAILPANLATASSRLFQLTHRAAVFRARAPEVSALSATLLSRQPGVDPKSETGKIRTVSRKERN
jgi:hypothetical protein